MPSLDLQTGRWQPRAVHNGASLAGRGCQDVAAAGANPADPAIRPIRRGVNSALRDSRHPHLRRHLRRDGRRQAPRLPARSRRRGTARRMPDGGDRRPHPRRGLRRRRHGDDHAPSRDDDRRRQSPPLRLLPDGRSLRHGAGAPPAGPARRDRPRRRVLLRAPGQRHDLPGDDADRPRPRPAARPQPGALPARRRDGLERRQRRHHHRQPAEHDHRLDRRPALCRVRGGADAGGVGLARRHDRPRGVLHPKEFFTRERLVAPKLRPSRPNRPLVAKTLLALVG